MNPLNRFKNSYAPIPDEETARQLQNPSQGWYTVEAQPPRHDTLPSSLDSFLRGIREFQTKWLGLRNASPTISYELLRPKNGELTFRYASPTKRLERKIRTHLTDQIPGVRFQNGTSGIPVSIDETVGGGLITAGRSDWFPLQFNFSNPPVNALVGALHRHAMQDTGVLTQILFQPVIGQPVRNWWRTRRTYQYISYLRKEKEKLWGSRQPTPREKKQAKLIEYKAGNPRFNVSIRFLVYGAGEFTKSRIKELAGAFNVYENTDSGQYLDPVTIESFHSSRILDFAESVVNRRLDSWNQPFQASNRELAPLLTLPDRTQDNIHYATP